MHKKKSALCSHTCAYYVQMRGFPFPQLSAAYDEDQRWCASDVAGLTTAAAAANNDMVVEGDRGEHGLLVMPLDALLVLLHERTGTNRVALLVTLQEHTRLIVSDGTATAPQSRWRLLCFDPLCARLSTLDARTPYGARTALGLPRQPQPYAGLLVSDSAASRR